MPLSFREEEEEEDEFEEESLALSRELGAKAQDYCAVCTEDNCEDSELLLKIDLTRYDIYFCKKHELELLSKLLGNYLKRVEKKKELEGILKDTVDAA